jgi:uncharacterized protein YqjF (DUF2071 family)
MDHDSQFPLRCRSLSAAARERMLSLPREPLFIADWTGVVMIHLEVDARELQRVTPFQLDLWNGRAFVTLVAFTLRGMRPRFGGRLGRMLFSPLSTHRFLNVRTYVRHANEAGIHFLAEWLDSWLAVQLGPRLFGLPYRLGRIEYQNDSRGRRREEADGVAGDPPPHLGGYICGRVVDARSGAAFEYRAGVGTNVPNFAPCATGSLDEWLMERYTAFNNLGGGRRFFRVWHEPWPQVPVQVELSDRSLIAGNWPFLGTAKIVGANHSPGVRGVWMGWPHRLREGLSTVSTKACCPEGVG